MPGLHIETTSNPSARPVARAAFRTDVDEDAPSTNDHEGEFVPSSWLRLILPPSTKEIKYEQSRRIWLKLGCYWVIPAITWSLMWLWDLLDPVPNTLLLSTGLIGIFMELLRLRRIVRMKWRSLFLATCVLQLIMIAVVIPNGIANDRANHAALHTPSNVDELLSELKEVKHQMDLGSKVPSSTDNIAAPIDFESLMPLVDTPTISPRAGWESPFDYQWLPGHRVEAMAPLRIPPSSPLTTMSIVVISFDEHDYVKRTLDSIVEFTNPDTLYEIILVDDFSSPPLTNDFNMDDYPAGKVRYIRNEARVGLIQSRATGANAARGDVVVFFDCHVKPRSNWETSILQRINENYRHVVVPAIPVLDGDSWEQKGAAVGYKMMMEWNLGFHWFEDGNDDVPIMSGGLLAISKDWWHESGEYDLGMLQWGAENIEQSLRVWLCGGEISVARDSEVLHLFRKSFPYKLDGSVVHINKARTVGLWFDDYVPYYDNALTKETLLAKHDIKDRIAHKESHDCKDIRWWVERFREVLTSRGMIPARTFQLRLKDTASSEMAFEVPEVPKPPSFGPSALTMSANDGWCLIPVPSLSAYFDKGLEEAKLISNDSEDSTYHRFVKTLNKSSITQMMNSQSKRNIASGLTVVPCSSTQDTLRWRHGSDELERFVYIGKSNDTAVFGGCLQMSSVTLNVNASVSPCQYNLFKKTQGKNDGQQFSLLKEKSVVNGISSNLNQPADFASYGIKMSAQGASHSCLSVGSYVKSFETELPVVVNTSCSDDPTSLIWSEVNMRWDLNDALKIVTTTTSEPKKLRGGN